MGDRTNFTVIHGGPCCKYLEASSHLPCSQDVVFNGYFQSYKYFESATDQIRREFKFRREIISRCRMKFRVALTMASVEHRNETSSSSSCVLVGVHLRRGDYLEPSKLKFGHTAATVEYLQRAVTFYEHTFESSPCLIFIVLGNDYRWNREAVGNLTIESNRSRFAVLQEMKGGLAGVDMCVLSQCNHTIMSTGTFGWWSAYLTGGRTTYQAEYARNGSAYFDEIEPEDFFLPSWVPL